MYCAKTDVPVYYWARSCKMSAEVSWTRCLIWKITVTCGALLAWYQQLFIKVLQATFLTFVKPTSMAYFVQFDPAMNKCIFVSTRNRTSKEGDVSSVVYQHLMDHLLKDCVEKVYPVGSRAKKCIYVLLAYINVQSSFRWITITIQTVVLPLGEETLLDYSVIILLRNATSLSDQTSSMLYRWLAVVFTFIYGSNSWCVSCLYGEWPTLYFTFKFLRNNLPMIAFALKTKM